MGAGEGAGPGELTRVAKPSPLPNVRPRVTLGDLDISPSSTFGAEPGIRIVPVPPHRALRPAQWIASPGSWREVDRGSGHSFQGNVLLCVGGEHRTAGFADDRLGHRRQLQHHDMLHPQTLSRQTLPDGKLRVRFT